MEQLITEDLKSEYPFRHNFYQFKDNHKLHYVDEGESVDKTVLMVHGNPTWSFFYRNLIKKLSPNTRVIAPDHMGCGLSDKPENYPYNLEKHIDNLKCLVESLIPNDQMFDVVVHDWGGAIGLGLAGLMPDRVRKVVILNTAAFTSSRIPKRINACKVPFFGERMIRMFNGFAYPAIYMAVKKPLSPVVKKGFLFPYNNYQNRIATAKFVQDIPMRKSHPSWTALKNVEYSLDKIKGEKMILWGGKDFCFDESFYQRWLSIYPEAKTFYYENSGHYLLEDSPEACDRIKDFLTS